MKSTAVTIFAGLTIVWAIVSQMTQWATFRPEYGVGSVGLWRGCGASGDGEVECGDIEDQVGNLNLIRSFMIIGTVVMLVVAILAWVKVVPTIAVILMALASMVMYVTSIIVWFTVIAERDEIGQTNVAIGAISAIVSAVFSTLVVIFTILK